VPIIVHWGFPEVAVPSPPVDVGPKTILGDDESNIFWQALKTLARNAVEPVIYRSEPMSEDTLAKQAAKARIFIFFILFFFYLMVQVDWY
jgi:hypothetical protein